MKRIALINDLSGFGKCSLTAAIPVISVMGIQACPLPTAVLSAQTGFNGYFCDNFTDRMDNFTEHWKSMEVNFDGIYSGYLADSLQMDKVHHFLEQFQDNDNLYLADPVMGDYGRAYGMFNEKFLLGMRSLTAKADVITPNLTELCLLAGVEYSDLYKYSGDEDYLARIRDICENLLAKAFGAQTILVTGVLRAKAGKEYVGNLAVSEKDTFYIENPYTGRGFSGTGDLFASVICGSLVKGLTVREAMELAADFLKDAIEDASREDIPSNQGVQFEKYLSRLI